MTVTVTVTVARLIGVVCMCHCFAYCETYHHFSVIFFFLLLSNSIRIVNHRRKWSATKKPKNKTRKIAHTQTKSGMKFLRHHLKYWLLRIYGKLSMPFCSKGKKGHYGFGPEDQCYYVIFVFSTVFIYMRWFFFLLSSLCLSHFRISVAYAWIQFGNHWAAWFVALVYRFCCHCCIHIKIQISHRFINIVVIYNI